MSGEMRDTAVVTGSVLGSVGAPAAVVGVVQTLGFGTGGILANSLAASFMAGSGNVAAGSTCAILQSVGATAALGTAATVGSMAIPLIGGAVYLGLKYWK